MVRTVDQFVVGGPMLPKLSISYWFFFLSKRIFAARITVPAPLPFLSSLNSHGVWVINRAARVSKLGERHISCRECTG